MPLTLVLKMDVLKAKVKLILGKNEGWGIRQASRRNLRESNHLFRMLLLLCRGSKKGTVGF